MNVVIDTNVLYSWCGTSPNPKLPATHLDALAAQHQFFVASPTLAEIVTHYADELVSLQQCLGIVFRPSVKYLRIATVPLDETPFQQIAASGSVDDARAAIASIRETKIRCEADFLKGIFVATAVGSLGLVAHDEELTAEASDIIRGLIAMTPGAVEVSLALEPALREYYQTNVVGDLKKTFAGLLAGVLNAAGMLVHAVRQGIDPSKLSEIDAETGDRIVAAVQSDPRFNHLGVDEAVSPLFGLTNNGGAGRVELLLRQMMDEAFPSTYPNKLKEYLRLALRSLLVDKAKIDKNDIMDMMLLLTADWPDTVILTLDKGFLKRLGVIHPPSYAFSTGAFLAV